MANRSATSKRKAALARRNACPPGFVTREMLCDALGISESHARSLSARGVLTADWRNDGNFALYSKRTLERLQAEMLENATAAVSAPMQSYPIEQGVRVFELLGTNTPPSQIVTGERIHPKVFLEIRDDYERAVGEIDLPKAMVARVNEIAASRGERPVASSLELLAFIEKLAGYYTCTRCSIYPSTTLCHRCATR